MTVQTQSLPYSAGGLTMVGHFAQAPDASPSSPGVLVLPEWWGLNTYIRRRTEDLARLGYTALGVDLYGAGTTADHPEPSRGTNERNTRRHGHGYPAAAGGGCRVD